MSAKNPQSVLFACTLNAVRSPMAEALARQALGRKAYVASAGVTKSDVDPFAVAVMRESGLDISGHLPHTFDETDCTAFDLVVALSPEAENRARELTRAAATQVEYWPVPDLSGHGESRAQKIEAFREVRELLRQKIKARFGA